MHAFVYLFYKESQHVTPHQQIIVLRTLPNRNVIYSTLFSSNWSRNLQYSPPHQHASCKSSHLKMSQHFYWLSHIHVTASTKTLNQRILQMSIMGREEKSGQFWNAFMWQIHKFSPLSLISQMDLLNDNHFDFTHFYALDFDVFFSSFVQFLFLFSIELVCFFLIIIFSFS